MGLYLELVPGVFAALFGLVIWLALVLQMKCLLIGYRLGADRKTRFRDCLKSSIFSWTSLLFPD